MILLDFLKSNEKDITEVFQACKYFKKQNWLIDYKCKSLQDEGYLKVNEFRELLSENDFIGAISKLTGINEAVLIKTKITDVFYFFSFLLEELEVIIKTENYINSLQSDYPSDEEGLYEQAGVERLNKFSYYNVIDELAFNDITKHKEIGEKTYKEILTKLLRDKDLKIIRENYNGLKKPINNA